MRRQIALVLIFCIHAGVAGAGSELYGRVLGLVEPAEDGHRSELTGLDQHWRPEMPAFLLVAPWAWTLVTEDQGFVAFGGEYPFSESTIEVGEGRIRLLVSAGKLPVGKDAVRSWIEMAARTMARYYGRFPSDEVTVTVLAGKPGRVFGGTTYGGRVIRINVGRQATAATLAEDWRMPHELLHLAFADLGDDYLYLEEGLATYVEPIIRAQAGQLTEEKVWSDFYDGMPHGARNPRGMDGSSSWGTLYWGGARFWLLADLEIRRKTEGRRTLRDALKAILEGGGNGKVHLELRRMLALGDAGTGTNVLRDLHARLGARSEPADLDGLWKELGVEKRDGTVVLRDDASLAHIRKAITRRAR